MAGAINLLVVLVAFSVFGQVQSLYALKPTPSGNAPLRLRGGRPFAQENLVKTSTALLGLQVTIFSIVKCVFNKLDVP